MSYSTRDRARIQRMATRVGITDLYDFAKQAMGDGWWENFNHTQAAEFEAKIEAFAAPAPQAPSAPAVTARQADYIGSLLARRANNGEGGGFASVTRFFTADGNIDAAAVRALTKAEASTLIDSLTSNY